MAPLHVAPPDRERLKHALLQSDDETRRLIGPLLGLEPVQQLLVSFLRDSSRSFEDHVWDPIAQDVLRRLRDSTNGVQPEVAKIFERELLHQGRTSGALDATEEALMADVDAAQADGKIKFKRGDRYPAMNAFKKSERALLAYHQDQYYGKVIDPPDWEEDELRDRYVTLCCNVAVCGIKLLDHATTRLYATKALRVNGQSSKALYAAGKVDLMEQKYEEARAQVEKAIGLHPGNAQFPKLLREIEQAQKRELGGRSELQSAKKLYDELAKVRQEQQTDQEKMRRAKLARAAEVTPLPTLHDDGITSQHLNIYFMRIKQKLRVDIDQQHDPDNGEPPLFECTIWNESTGEVLAAGVKASSKKAAKQAASKLAIKTLWVRKKKAGKLLPDESEQWDAHERAEQEGKPFISKDPGPADGGDDSAAVVPLPRSHDDGVIRLIFGERTIQPAALLHQLGMQRRLAVDFAIEDVALSKGEPLFKCTCAVNGEELAVATAQAKKMAKAEAGRLAMDVAISKGLIEFARMEVTSVDRAALSDGDLGTTTSAAVA